jgi:hypothetical protein
MSFSNFNKVKPKNGQNPPPRTPRSKLNKSKLKKELRILISCSRSGHKKYLEHPKYDINDAEELNARINELIDLISK